MESLIRILNEYSVIIMIGLIIIILLLFIMTMILLSSVNRVEKKYKKMMRGIDHSNLEELINSNLDKIDKAIKKAEEAEEECKKIEEQLKVCVKKIAIKRYKAFEDVGSDLSFSVAILDSYNDGIILTGIYSRQDSTTYAKPIDKGISRYNLSEEELCVLNEAINSKLQ